VLKALYNDCFVTEGVWFRDELGMQTPKHLKSDAVPMIFAKSVDYLEPSSASSSSESKPTSQPLSEKRQQNW